MFKTSECSERAIKVAVYIIENKATIRQTANVFNVSKSTIHKDVTERLRYVDRNLYYEVRKVLNYNILQRTIRGGEATRKKYKK